jgi:hypothetical protein
MRSFAEDMAALAESHFTTHTEPQRARLDSAGQPEVTNEPRRLRQRTPTTWTVGLVP